MNRKVECACTSVMISTSSRGTIRCGLLSPACGPAPVTVVPVTNVADSASALSKVKCRNGFGTTGVGMPSSGWPILT